MEKVPRHSSRGWLCLVSRWSIAWRCRTTICLQTQHLCYRDRVQKTSFKLVRLTSASWNRPRCRALPTFLTKLLMGMRCMQQHCLLSAVGKQTWAPRNEIGPGVHPMETNQQVRRRAPERGRRDSVLSSRQPCLLPTPQVWISPVGEQSR